MIHEWRHLKMAKRSGRGHDPGGIETTSQGALVVPCQSCPLSGINLPENWCSFPDNLQCVISLYLWWLSFLNFLVLDGSTLFSLRWMPTLSRRPGYDQARMIVTH